IAARADGAAVGSLTHFNLEGRALVVGKTNRPVDERLVSLDAIEDSLQLHPVPLQAGISSLDKLIHTERRSRMHLNLVNADGLSRAREAEQKRGKEVGVWGR